MSHSEPNSLFDEDEDMQGSDSDSEALSDDYRGLAGIETSHGDANMDDHAFQSPTYDAMDVDPQQPAPEDQAIPSLVEKPMSIGSFCRDAKRLFQCPDKGAFVKFALTGICDDHQAILDPFQNACSEDYGITGRRDFDSLLGIDAQICINSGLTLFPVANHRDTLTSNIHLSHRFAVEDGSFTAPIHKVPNLALGKWDVRTLIRSLFPSLYTSDRRQVQLSQDEQRIFYEKGFRPAIVLLDRDRAAEWPPTYDSEMFRARDSTGKLIFQTRLFPDTLVPALGDAIRSQLSDRSVSWGDGMVFLHEIRGVKELHGHSMNPHAGKTAYHYFVQHHKLNLDDIDQANWFIDVGVEFYSKQLHCLQWRTDSHFHILHRFLELPEGHARRLTTPGSSQYNRDLASHLTAVSGYRITPGVSVRPNPYQIRYTQAYTTDKALTYKPSEASGHHSKYITCDSVLTNPDPTAFCRGLYDLYLDAAQSNSSHARLEVRVPLSSAENVLTNLSRRVVCQSLFYFPKIEWWSLRAYRLQACQLVFEWHADGHFQHQADERSLQLLAACIWLINGLHSRPDDGPSYRNLLEVVLPHVDRISADRNTLLFNTRTRATDTRVDTDNDDGEDNSAASDDDLPSVHRRGSPTIPYVPFGIVFLSSIRVSRNNPVARMANPEGSLQKSAFMFFFHCPLEDMVTKYFQPGFTNAPIPGRVSNKSRRTANWVNLSGEEANVSNLFRLEDRGFTLPATSQDDDGPSEEPAEGLDARLSLLWRQFVIDILNKAPNTLHGASYCSLSADQRASATDDIFKDMVLSNSWNDVQWKLATDKEWGMIFDRLWPGSETTLPHKQQNYRTCQYYLQWTQLISNQNLDAGTIKVMRATLSQRFDTLEWMCHAQTERIWHTKHLGNFVHGNGATSGAAPRILMRNGSPSWNGA